jgi:hypothetical protein
MRQVTKENIQNVLSRVDNVGHHAIGRALVHLLNRQTISEQQSENTLEHNLKGFTSSDARWGTINAKFYQKNGYLGERCLAIWRKPNSKGIPKIAKYWRQLLEEAVAKQKSV